MEESNLPLPELPFQGDVVSIYNFKEGDSWFAVLLVKLHGKRMEWVSWIYSYSRKGCMWGNYGSEDYARSSFNLRVKERK